MSRTHLLQALGRVLGKPDRTDREWVNYTCPFCAGKQKFGVNLSSGRCRCFKCGSNPWVGAVFRLFGVPLPPVGILPRGRSSTHILSVATDAKEDTAPVSLRGWKRLPASPNDDHDERVIRYAVKRGADLDRWEIGTLEEAPERAVFLVRDAGIPISWQGRAIFAGMHPKTLNPPSDVGVPRGSFVFGLEHCRPGCVLAIGEGAFDAVALDRPEDGVVGVALFGKNATRDQIELLRCSGAKRVVVALDPDAPAESAMLAKRLQEVGIDTAVVDWSGYSLDDDPGSIGVDRMAELVDGARPLTAKDRIRAIAAGSRLRRDMRWRRTIRPSGQQP